jgi:hypothetical protein
VNFAKTTHGKFTLFVFRPNGGAMQNQEFAWLSVRLPAEKHEAVKAQARRAGVSVSDIVRMALDNNLIVVRGDHGVAAERQPPRREVSFA